jgi:hypothetical protein
MFKEAEKSLKHEIGELSNSVNRLDKENEEKKAQRAVRFNADKKKALVAFLCGAIPLAICIALAIYFSTVMFSSESGVFLILAIVFAGLSFVGIIVVAFLGRALNITARRVRLNKKNTSTKIGRQLIAEEKRLEAFNAVYAVLQDK